MSLASHIGTKYIFICFCVFKSSAKLHVQRFESKIDREKVVSCYKYRKPLLKEDIYPSARAANRQFEQLVKQHSSKNC